MLMVDNADPVMIGNRIESVIPYTMNDDFTVPAVDRGKVIELTKEYMVVQYTNGNYKTIDLRPQMERNTAAGFWIVNTLTTDLKKGDSFTKNQILAWNPKAFTKFNEERKASMNLGALVKIAVVSSWDVYEDSSPLSERASDLMATDIGVEKQISLDKNTTVDFIVKIGQYVKSSDILIKFDESTNDKDDSKIGNKLVNEVRTALGEMVIDSSGTSVHSKYDGTVTDIRVYSTVPTNQLSPSLQKIIGDYHKRINSINKVMEKYSNAGDSRFYKSGNVIRESDDPIKPDIGGKIKGKKVDDGVLICIYVTYKDYMKKGDKISSETALKATISHPYIRGMEPYSEWKPDEVIDHIVAPLSISARKTPTIFLAMFGNKVIMGLKDKLIEDFFKD